MKQFLLFILFAIVTLSCGTSPTINVRLRAADNNPQGNPFANIETDYVANISNGLYFEVYELNPCPVTIEDISASRSSPVITQPSQGERGLSPASESFTIDISRLDQSKAYALKVRAVLKDGTQITHEGSSNCPIFPSDAGKQAITLCLAPKGINPICQGATSFGSCRFPSRCN